MSRYRYRIGKKVGRWQPSQYEAAKAAARAGFGSMDEYEPAPGDFPPTVYLHPLVDIEKEPDA